MIPVRVWLAKRAMVIKPRLGWEEEEEEARVREHNMLSAAQGAQVVRTVPSFAIYSVSKSCLY